MFPGIHPNESVQRKFESEAIAEAHYGGGALPRGAAHARARGTNRVRLDACFLPFHWEHMAVPLSITCNHTPAEIGPHSRA